MKNYTVTLEASGIESSRRVLVGGADEYEAMAIAQLNNPGWYPVDVQVSK